MPCKFKEVLKKRFLMPVVDAPSVLEKNIKPGAAIDYSKHQRPVDAHDGAVKPIHNPIQHGATGIASLTKPKDTLFAGIAKKTPLAKSEEEKARETEELKKSVKSKIASAVAASAALMPKPAGEMPGKQSVSVVAKPSPAVTPGMQAPAGLSHGVQPSIATAPSGALVRAHTGADMPEFHVNNKWIKPMKVAEMIDFLSKNPQHAAQYDAVSKRMMQYRKASAGKSDEGYVYHQ